MSRVQTSAEKATLVLAGVAAEVLFYHPTPLEAVAGLRAYGSAVAVAGLAVRCPRTVPNRLYRLAQALVVALGHLGACLALKVAFVSPLACYRGHSYST